MKRIIKGGARNTVLTGIHWTGCIKKNPFQIQSERQDLLLCQKRPLSYPGSCSWIFPEHLMSNSGIQ